MDMTEVAEHLRPVFAKLTDGFAKDFRTVEMTAADMVAIFSAMPPDSPVGIYNVSGGGQLTLDMIYPGDDGVDFDMSRTDPNPFRR